MSLRLIEVVIAENQLQAARDVIEDLSERGIVRFNVLNAGGSTNLLRLITPIEASEILIDKLREQFSSLEEFRIVVLAAEATIPELQAPEMTPEVRSESWFSRGILERISRDELLNDIERMTRISPSFCAFVVLSTIVAAVGLFRNSPAVLIGAMVIAPLLGPNIALAFGTALGDLKLIQRALKINVVGSGLALSLSLCIGFVVGDGSGTAALAERVHVGVDDIVLALASGAAGVLSLTGGASAALVGVMVAVALLPPLVSFGILLGSGYPEEAGISLLLLVINVISVNLSAVATFVFQKVNPLSWSEGKRAREYRTTAIIFWSVILFTLVILLYKSV